jgi:hypothetical protein
MIGTLGSKHLLLLSYSPFSSIISSSAHHTRITLPPPATGRPEPIESSVTSKDSALDFEMSDFDSHVFSTSRLRNQHGYRLEPSINDTYLGGRIPSFRSHWARVVEVRKRLWLIWSPNSSQDPFYPGPALPFNGVPTASSLDQRRSDGHGGKWDYTRFPQPYAPNQLWLGMITREGTQETSSVEFVSATTVWESTSDSEGYIQPDYLLSLAARNEAVEQATASHLPLVSHC